MTSPPWLIVTGDFTPLGGMDRANYALASYLAGREGAEVHLVAHRVWPDLAAQASVQVHHAFRPKGSHLLGIPFLSSLGRTWAGRLSRRGGRVVVNGGNCQWGDVNWVHYVHAAWTPDSSGTSTRLRRLKGSLHAAYSLRSERKALQSARVIVANSDRTRADLITKFNIPAERVHTVYYGSDPDRFGLITPHERNAAKTQFGWLDDRLTVAFVGALGDHRKGFDTLFNAWKLLNADPSWQGRLVVAGAGASLPYWRTRAALEGLGDCIEFLGFRDDVAKLLAACDLLVSPTRYEAYGLNVQEALCRGLPAIVSATAGVAERYPKSLSCLLLPDPNDTADLAERLRSWNQNHESIHSLVGPLGQSLRERTWSDCAAEFVAIVERPD